MSEAIFETKNVSKIFGLFKAVDNVDFSIKENDAVGIFGPNGAGKTTFINILTGEYIPEEGRVFFQGEDITSMKSEKRVAKGIVRTFQLVHVFDNITAFENLALSIYRKMENKSMPLNLYNTNFKKHNKITEKVEEALRVFSLEKESSQIVGNLSLGSQKRLEIAMAWISDPHVFILDEPFAGISDHEIDEIIEILKKQLHKKTIIIVEHKLSKLTEIVDTLCVMHEGKMIASGPCEETLNNPVVRKSYWKIEE
ncbi:MAG: ATP-binding cassette domain-containing protein [Spirochaetia bacterium]|jgi:branched-chain amino acid transport system ATP-binding protein|nr:ATP-binding cassette domain-containing protein [Spirochaetia bacterium]